MSRYTTADPPAESAVSRTKSAEYAHPWRHTEDECHRVCLVLRVPIVVEIRNAVTGENRERFVHAGAGVAPRHRRWNCTRRHPKFAEILGKSARGDVAGSGSEHTTTDCGVGQWVRHERVSKSKTSRVLTSGGAQRRTIELRILIIYSGVRQARHKPLSCFNKIK